MKTATFTLIAILIASSPIKAIDSLNVVGTNVSCEVTNNLKNCYFDPNGGELIIEIPENRISKMIDAKEFKLVLENRQEIGLKNNWFTLKNNLFKLFGDSLKKSLSLVNIDSTFKKLNLKQNAILFHLEAKIADKWEALTTNSSVHIKVSNEVFIASINGKKVPLNLDSINFHIDDIVTIKVKDNVLSNFSSTNPIKIWLNHNCANNIRILGVNNKESTITFQFNFEKQKDTDVLPWKSIYAWANRKNIIFGKTELISIGIGNDKQEYASSAGNFGLVVTENWMKVIGISLIFFLIISFIYLAKFTDILRVGPEEFERTINLQFIPFSLSRTLMAWWTLIILSTVIYITFIIDEFPVITTNLVLLLGVSGATSVISRLIESFKKAPNSEPYTPTTLTDGLKSKGLFKDISSENGSKSLARLQLILFSGIIGAYFVWFSIYNLKLMDVNSELLTLLGVSSGVYAGNKLKEN